MSERIRKTSGAWTLAKPPGPVITGKSLADELDRLHAIVERLPKTADGVPVAPGMELFVQNIYDRQIYPLRVESVSDDGSLLPGLEARECYSTRELAEAAIATLERERDHWNGEADTWKKMANEYAAVLQPLLMERLYPICEPVSHRWPGRRHVDCLPEAVECILSRVASLESRIATLVKEVEGLVIAAKAVIDNEARLDAEVAIHSSLRAKKQALTDMTVALARAEAAVKDTKGATND